jgi:basic membrane protein A and related proteins
MAAGRLTTQRELTSSVGESAARNKGDCLMTAINLSRRAVLSGSAALVSFGTTGAARRAAAAESVTVGIVYVGARDDFGWNQAHAVGAKALKSVPNVKVLEEERVPETTAVTKTMESMVRLDGAKLVLGTSFGYFDPFMIDLAKQFPDIDFRHSTMLWDAAKHPKNLGSYFCYIDQAHYINGVAAGLSTKSNKLGFIAPKTIGVVLRDVNSFAVGARKVNPNATVQLIVTGDWALPVREAEATNALIDAGCDVIATRVDSPKIVVEAAEARGIKTTGHATSQASLAPKGFITGAEMKWETIYKNFAALLAKGEKLPNTMEGGYDKDFVQNTPFGAGATEPARKAALAAMDDLRAGKPVFIGPVKSNTGKLISADTLELYHPSLWKTDYLVEGVIGSLS